MLERQTSRAASDEHSIKLGTETCGEGATKHSEKGGRQNSTPGKFHAAINYDKCQHIVIPQAGFLAGGTQADAAVTEATGGAMKK